MLLGGLGLCCGPGHLSESSGGVLWTHWGDIYNVFYYFFMIFMTFGNKKVPKTGGKNAWGVPTADLVTKKRQQY